MTLGGTQKAVPGASLTETLANYWATASFDDLPQSVIAAAKRFLLDTLAAGIAGANTPVATAARDAMVFPLESASGSTSGGSSGTSVVWGTPARLPAAQAALVNGTAAHALELDDFDGCGHSGAVVIPAVCAMADRVGGSGQDVLTAIVAGYDVASRVLEGAGGYRSHNDRGWHSTGTCGSFGASAAVARMLALEPARFAHALGIAGTFTGGIWAFLEDGAMTKRLHPGKASETGVTAALLAKAGMTGPRFVLDATWGGFFSTYAGTAATPDATIADLGSDFRILASGIKPYACCRGMHGCIDSLLDTMASGMFDREAIERLIVHGDARIGRQFGRQRIGTLLDAQFSLPYVLAVAADGGRATLDQFVPLRHEEPTIRDFMAVVEIADDRSLAAGENPELDIRLRDGRRFSHRTATGRGGAGRPLSDAEIVAKAESLMTPLLGDAKAREIVALVQAFERADAARRLTALLVGPRAV